MGKTARFLAGLLVFTILIVSAGSAVAEDIDDLKDQQSFINKQLENIKNSIQKLNNDKKSVAEQIAELDKQLSIAEKELAEVETKLKETQEKLANAVEELKIAQERVEQQKEDLSVRMRALYKTGPLDYIEVLLASASFSDFLTRLDMIEQIIKADTELLNEFRTRQQEIADKKAEIEEQQRLIAQQRDKIDDRRAKIASYRGDRQRLLAELEKQKQEYERQQDKLEKEAEELRRKILAWEMKNKKGYFGTGQFIWPTPGYTTITSDYGWRIHPIFKTRRFHDGIDIGAPMGAAVVAVDDGEVIFAGSYGGYGNTIIVSHGGGISTQYSHLSRMLVSKGKKVLKGDKIGLVGSTGWSTGPHLHFTVIQDGNSVSPWKWLK